MQNGRDAAHMRTRIPLLAAVAAVVLAAIPVALANRNSSGTYSLPTGNPVLSGTTISSTWANTTLNDLAAEVTNSLDRQGRGSMSAPLRLANGISSAPGLTWANEPNSGLYRNAASDERMAVASTDVQQWTNSASTFFVPVTVSALLTATNLKVTSSLDSITVTAASANANAITATGNGTGKGINATGGASSGYGGNFVGGAPNGYGIYTTGVGSGVGIFGQGGSSAGVGVIGNGGTGAPGGTFAGGTSGGGVIASGGTGNTYGLQATGQGSGNGVTATGGTTGYGVYATGGLSGVVGINNTGATSTVRQDALTALNGDLSFDGSAVPASTTSVKNRVTNKNIIKVDGAVAVSGNTATITDGFNLASVATSNQAGCANNQLDITFAQAFASTSYVVTLATEGLNVCQPVIASKSTTGFSVRWFAFWTGTNSYQNCFSGGCTATRPSWDGITLNFIATGAQ